MSVPLGVDGGFEPADVEITQLLHAMADGDPTAEENLFTVLHGQLRLMAERAMAGQPVEHTLQPTALVNEAYLRVIRTTGSDFVNRTHFLSVAAKAMRHLLVDHARKKNSVKRMNGGTRVGLDAVLWTFEERSEDLEALDAALRDFAKFDPKMALAIELRFFGGASVEDAAEAIGMSVRTFERRWQTARHFLRSQLVVG